jgi:tripartite-type tricarboxylate transporter receptor subunit TctC
MTGEVQAVFATLTSARPFIESGKVKAVGLASRSRSTIAPDIRSADESGAKGFDVQFWFGLMAPTGTPDAVVKQINADVREVLQRPDVKDRLSTMALTAAPTTPEEFGRIVRHESERWVSTAKRAGVEAQ